MKTNTAKSAIIGIYTLLLFAFVIICLYYGQVILMPLALAILLAFLLSPLVSKFERVVGRVLAVVFAMLLMIIAVGVTGYVLSKELVHFANDLTTYKTNINSKMSAVENYKSFFNRSFDTLNDVKSTITNKPSTTANKNELFNLDQVLLAGIEGIFASFVFILTNFFLVLLLASFILIDKEALRGRVIRLIGQERIGSTAHVIDDASKRVSRYLWMLLLINVCAGIMVAIGLYFIGIQNALLWGFLTALLRFVPYVGTWISAAIPIAVSFAISTTWLTPLLTIGLFIFIDALCFNLLEPLLLGNTTGISPTALVISALFWTLLWGPIGLILSTPFTVCLVVLGNYVPKLEFFNILISDEKPLTLHEEIYHRLLGTNVSEVIQLTDRYLKDNSLTSFYDTVLIPVINAGEIDSRKEILDYDQVQNLQQNIGDMIEDLSTRPVADQKENKDQIPQSLLNEENELKLQRSTIVILSIPAKTKSDELVAEMFTQLLRQKNFNALHVPLQLKKTELLDYIKENNPTMILISVSPPFTIMQARYLSRQIRSSFPTLKIIMGLWGYQDNLTSVAEELYGSGTNEIVTTLTDAVTTVENNAS